MEIIPEFGLTAAQSYYASRSLWEITLNTLIDCGSTQRDLVDLGMTPAEARTALSRRKDRPWHPNVVQMWEAHRDHRGGSGRAPFDQITLVPAAESAESLARSTMNGPLSYYARDLGLSGSIPRQTTHLAISENGAITHTRPLVRRFYVPTPATTTGDDWLDDITASHDYAANWPGPSDVMLLDAPVPLSSPIPLGMRGVRGVASYYRISLESASSVREASTVNQAWSS